MSIIIKLLFDDVTDVLMAEFKSENPGNRPNSSFCSWVHEKYGVHFSWKEISDHRSEIHAEFDTPEQETLFRLKYSNYRSEEHTSELQSH